MPYPSVTFQNQLTVAVNVYDAFNNNDEQQNTTDYFGTLTLLGNVPAGGQATFTPINGPISTYIVYDVSNNPVVRTFTLGAAASTFQVTQADVAVITATKAFITLTTTSPTDPQVVSFLALIKNGASSAEAINSFFQGTTNYNTCTFVSYMLAITQMAQQGQQQLATPASAVYSLSQLCGFFNVSWPSGFPDVAITNFSCTEANGDITLGGTIEISGLPDVPQATMTNLLSMLPSATAQFTLNFNYGSGGNTSLQIVLPNISVPTGNGNTFQLQTPTLYLSINPLFKFVIFEISATVPFNIFGSPTFDAALSMTIDNDEAAIGVVVTGNNNTLFTPPILQGIHFDTIGVSMGLFFEPPGYVLGVEGAFHVGDGTNNITLDDNQFLIVCEFDGPVPNPLYISFYIPQLNLSEIITMFTNTPNNIDVPVSFNELSFVWMEDPMAPITLPDGQLSQMAYGFSAYADILGLQFYGNVQVNLTNGLSGIITMSPYSIGSIFSLTGNGQAVSIKVDANGNPIPNNVVPLTAAQQQATQAAATQQIIAPGGPEMTMSSSSSPYFTLDASATFLGSTDTIDCTVTSSGFNFNLQLSDIDISCVLNQGAFIGTFTYTPSLNISLPDNLGSINLTSAISVTINLSVSASNIDFSVSGSFTFNGDNLSFGPITLDENISGITSLIQSIENGIIADAENIFSSVTQDVSNWASSVYNKYIVPAEPGASYMVTAFKNTFNQVVGDVGSLLGGGNFAAQDVASAVQTIYGAQPQQIAGVLQTAGFSSSEAATALTAIGIGQDVVATALQVEFGLSPSAASALFQGASDVVSDIGSAASSIINDL